MSRLATRPPKCLLRAPALAARRCAGTRFLSGDNKPRIVSSEKDNGPSFKGQMMESIAARMEREKAERDRAAREKSLSAAPRNWGVTFCMFCSYQVFYLWVMMTSLS